PQPAVRGPDHNSQGHRRPACRDQQALPPPWCFPLARRTKTVGSVRICLGNVLTDVLAAHFQQSAHKAPEDFIVCSKEGSPLHPDVVRKDVLYPILDRLRIARTPGESGFHTFCTLDKIEATRASHGPDEIKKYASVVILQIG